MIKNVSKSMKIAVLIPCFNEAVAIAKVVQAFQAALPQALIYVYDNNSTDETALIAKQAGAQVRHHKIKGKGNVVRRMFADISADIYVLVDGDATYEAKTAPLMINELVKNQLDMVSAVREMQSEKAYRPGHQWGNKILTKSINLLFGEASDLLSGYRVFSKRFVKSFPVLSGGFEIETELSVHALQLKLPTGEVPSPYYERGEGSVSKLSTYKDGFRILKMIFRLLEQEKPFLFFGSLALVFFVVGLGFGIPLIATYFHTGLVPKFPTAILSTGLILLSFLSFFCGLILNSVAMSRKEVKQLAYLSYDLPEG
jgi:glycosyltransferase involved in cell wall biosynthesis